MPRNAKPYSQRTDLNTKVSAVAAPGQPYGQAGAELTAQKAVPMAAGPPSPAPQPMPSGQPPAQPPLMPGQMGSLFDPTNRPTEPVTAGAASGPGPGPEALSGGPQVQNVSQTLASIARVTNNPDIVALLNRAQAEGQ